MKNIIFVVALLIVGAFAVPASVDATGLSGPVELEGFAWASTIGWISMNCANDGLNGCATSDYKVQVETDGSMTGYAWSPNVGWIRFDATGPYPSGSAAIANGVYPDLTLNGWARACAGASNPLTCSGSINTNAGGWDGWISMSGSYGAGSYGIAFVNGAAANTPTSYAWGGPNTMGWIDFSPDAASGPSIPPVTLELIPDITIASLTYTPGIPDVAGNYPVTFTPTVLGIPEGETVNWVLLIGTLTDSGTVTQTGGVANFDSIPTLGSVPFSVTDDIVFEIDTNDDVAEIDETNNIFTTGFSLPFPPPTMSITGPGVIRGGGKAEISWEVSALYPVTCTVQGPGFPEPFTVTVVAGSPTANSRESAELQNAAQFVLTCIVGPDTYRETWLVDVIPTFQEV
jgi:hypothetical protein